MSAPHIILDILPSICQKLSDLVEVWRSYGVDSLLWRSTVGYPSDSLASCTASDCVTIGILLLFQGSAWGVARQPVTWHDVTPCSRRQRRVIGWGCWGGGARWSAAGPAASRRHSQPVVRQQQWHDRTQLALQYERRRKIYILTYTIYSRGGKGECPPAGCEKNFCNHWYMQ